MSKMKAFENLSTKEWTEKWDSFRRAFVNRNLDKVKKIIDNAKATPWIIQFHITQDNEIVEYAIYWEYEYYCLCVGKELNGSDKTMFCKYSEFLKTENIDDILDIIKIIKRIK